MTQSLCGYEHLPQRVLHSRS